MQKINVVCVGKMKEELRPAASEYLKRLGRFADVKITELPEKRTPAGESPQILRASKGYVIALCIEGQRLSSEEFAARLKSLGDRGEEITFIIGSSCGLDDAVKDRANLKLSFSDMTFPHQLMRVVLLEQIYRAYMINGGGSYHK